MILLRSALDLGAPFDSFFFAWPNFQEDNMLTLVFSFMRVVTTVVTLHVMLASGFPLVRALPSVHSVVLHSCQDFISGYPGHLARPSQEWKLVDHGRHSSSRASTEAPMHQVAKIDHYVVQRHGNIGQTIERDLHKNHVTRFASWTRKFTQTVRWPGQGVSRARLAKLGLAAVLGYGFVTNLGYVVTVSLSWYIHCANTGLSPLAPGQWKLFGLVNAGFAVFHNALRPVYLAVSMTTVGPWMDRLVARLEQWRLSRGWAVATVAVATNVVGTLVLMTTGVWVAATASQVPLFVGVA